MHDTVSFAPMLRDFGEDIARKVGHHFARYRCVHDYEQIPMHTIKFGSGPRLVHIRLTPSRYVDKRMAGHYQSSRPRALPNSRSRNLRHHYPMRVGTGRIPTHITVLAETIGVRLGNDTFSVPYSSMLMCLKLSANDVPRGGHKQAYKFLR